MRSIDPQFIQQINHKSSYHYKYVFFFKNDNNNGTTTEGDA